MTSVLSVNDLRVSFGGLRALSNVTFDAGEGTIIGLIGPNGAGKTTLFSTLMGLVRPERGAIALDGQRVDGLRPHVIARRGMTKTFQNTALFPDMTLLENVMTAALVQHDVPNARRIAQQCLDRVGLAPAPSRILLWLGCRRRPLPRG